MDTNYWHKQAADKPLFPELEWARPESKLHAGKLLIVGGAGYEFTAPANAYGDALDAGIGAAKVLLPASMQKVVADIFPEAEFAPSTPSGSFAHEALATLLDLAQWADAVLLPGNLGHNSETRVLVESFLAKYDGLVALAGDAVDVLAANVSQRASTALILTPEQMRTFGIAENVSRPFTTTLGLVQFVENLHDFTSTHTAAIVTRHEGQNIVAIQGQVSTTPSDTLANPATVAVWLLQHPTKPFEALTTSVL